MFICFVFFLLNTGILTVAQVTGDADCIDSYPSNWTGLYDGRKNITVTGKICKLWSDTYHNTYGQLNYCRAPGGDQESRKGPWCYLQDEEGWEFCFIPLCNKDCRRSLTDKNYHGTMNVTQSGHRCRKWILNTALPAGKPRSDYHGETLNYCRTPDGDSETKPWCYTTSQDARWEVCNVPICGDIKSTLCPDLIGSDLLVEPMILTGYQFDSVVKFTCTNGYTIEGPTSIKCTVDEEKTFKGHWNSTQPTCVEWMPDWTYPLFSPEFGTSCISNTADHNLTKLGLYIKHISLHKIAKKNRVRLGRHFQNGCKCVENSKLSDFDEN